MSAPSQCCACGGHTGCAHICDEAPREPAPSPEEMAERRGIWRDARPLYRQGVEDERARTAAHVAKLEAEVERLRADVITWKNRAHRHAQTMADALDAKTVEDARRILLRG